MAADEGNCSEAEKYMSSEVINAIRERPWEFEGGWKGLCDKITRNGTIQKIEILHGDAGGRFGAVVYFRIHFKDGETKDDSECLIEQGGQWKITFSHKGFRELLPRILPMNFSLYFLSSRNHQG
jgi:hypothetical protein